MILCWDPSVNVQILGWQMMLTMAQVLCLEDQEPDVRGEAVRSLCQLSAEDGVDGLNPERIATWHEYALNFKHLQKLIHDDPCTILVPCSCDDPSRLLTQGCLWCQWLIVYLLEAHIIQTIDCLLCFAQGEGGGASDFTAKSARHWPCRWRPSCFGRCGSSSGASLSHPWREIWATSSGSGLEKTAWGSGCQKMLVKHRKSMNWLVYKMVLYTASSRAHLTCV